MKERFESDKVWVVARNFGPGGPEPTKNIEIRAISQKNLSMGERSGCAERTPFWGVVGRAQSQSKRKKGKGAAQSHRGGEKQNRI